MRITRRELQKIGAAIGAGACAGEECVAGIGGDGRPYLSHIAFEVHNESGQCLGVLSSSNMDIPLSRLSWTPSGSEKK